MVAAAAAAGARMKGARAGGRAGWPRLTAQKGTEPRSPGWVETDGPTGREECSGAAHRDSERSDLGKRPSPSCRYSRGERHLAFLGGCSTGECRLALGASTSSPAPARSGARTTGAVAGHVRQLSRERSYELRAA